MISARQSETHKEYRTQKHTSHKKSSNSRRTLIRRIVAVWAIGLCVCIALGVTLISQHKTISTQKKQEKELNVELNQLSKDAKDLEKKIQLLNDDQYIAELARKDFFFSKKGEIIFSLPE